MAIRYVPVEFKGLAREFYRSVETAERAYDDALVARVMEPLRVRLARKPTLRKEQIIDITRLLRSMASPFRIASIIDVVKNGYLRITELVIGTAKDRDDCWEDDAWEKTTAILRMILTTEGGVAVRTAPVATIKGHAIARWHERTGSRDQAKLVSDIALILAAKEPDYVAATNGVWLGPIVNAYADVGGETRRMMMRSVRTYLSAEMIDTRIPSQMVASESS